MHALSPRFTPLAFLLPSLLLPALALGQSTKPAVGPVAPPAAAPAAGRPKPMRDYALYRAEVGLNSQGAQERRLATAKALSQVIVKLTGDVGAPANPVVRKALANAEAYVEEAADPVLASDAEGNTAVGGTPVFKTTMKFSFEATSVDALVAAAGLKYWTGVRPKPILWLAIDDGSGPRLVTAQQLGVVKPLASRGLERGLRFGLPQGTAVETAAVASVWSLDTAALVPLTARYGNDAQLVGKVYRSVSGWSAWWVLSQAGKELARWPVTDADPRKVIASGADPAADAIAARDGVFLDTGPAGEHRIEIAGVSSQEDYLRLMAYLQSLAIVRRVQVDGAGPGTLALTLDLGVGIRGFATMVGTDDTLEAEESADGARRFRLK